MVGSEGWLIGVLGLVMVCSYWYSCCVRCCVVRLFLLVDFMVWYSWLIWVVVVGVVNYWE